MLSRKLLKTEMLSRKLLDAWAPKPWKTVFEHLTSLISLAVFSDLEQHIWINIFLFDTTFWINILINILDQHPAFWINICFFGTTFWINIVINIICFGSTWLDQYIAQLRHPTNIWSSCFISDRQPTYIYNYCICPYTFGIRDTGWELRAVQATMTARTKHPGLIEIIIKLIHGKKYCSVVGFS